MCTAADLIALSLDIPEGRQVLAQRRMSGRLAKVFTDAHSNPYLQVDIVLGSCEASQVCIGLRAEMLGQLLTVAMLNSNKHYLPCLRVV